MFYYSLKVATQVYIYRKEEAQKLLQPDQRNKCMIRLGMFLLFIGFLLQVVALILSK